MAIDNEYQESNMALIELRVDDAPDIRFIGKIIAEAANTDDRGDSDFSGQTGRKDVLYLYRTQRGRYVCYIERNTRWVNERDTAEARVCDTVDEVVEFFGRGWLAKRLYRRAKLQDVVEIE